MSDRGLAVPVAAARVSTAAQLATLRKEEIWPQKQKSERSRRAYRLDVQHFMATLGIATADELRQADHKAVIVGTRYARGWSRRGVGGQPAVHQRIISVRLRISPRSL